MYKLHSTPLTDGSLAEVHIDQSNNLVKKIFKPSGITVNGSPNKYSDIKVVKKCFDNEIYWSTTLKSEFVVELLEYGELKDEPGYFLVQEYCGPALVEYKVDRTLYQRIPNINQQIEDMFAFFKERNVYKYNNALSNMTVKNGKIKAFDFKYASHRSLERKNDEIKSVILWISKIDKTLIQTLDKYI